MMQKLVESYHCITALIRLWIPSLLGGQRTLRPENQNIFLSDSFSHVVFF